MIARTWRGWTAPANADSYQALLTQQIMPGFRAIPGYRGGQVLRHDHADESEFVVINYFESLEAVKRFAGENFTIPVFEPEARALLSRIEEVANHYDVQATIEL